MIASNLRLLPYSQGTASGTELIRALGGLRIHPTRHTYRRKNAHRIINWGCSDRAWDGVFQRGDFNHPASVASAVDKLLAFEIWGLRGVSHPIWTVDQVLAQKWANSGILLGRDSRNGRKGEGITVYERGQEIARHQFYVVGVDSDKEYRVHASRSGIIDVVQKKRRKDMETVSKIIRSHDNGWVFCRNDITPPSAALLAEAAKAVAALDLDFGAVDICSTKTGEVVVFEVNTAPGIEGTTLSKYRDFFANA